MTTFYKTTTYDLFHVHAHLFHKWLFAFLSISRLIAIQKWCSWWEYTRPKCQPAIGLKALIALRMLNVNAFIKAMTSTLILVDAY